MLAKKRALTPGPFLFQSMAPGIVRTTRLEFDVKILLSMVMLLCSLSMQASDTITTEPGDDAYRFVSHYRIRIDAPVEIVWSHLIDLGSWMYDFEMSHVSGVAGKEGEVLRLYPGQDFFSQIISIVPNELLVVANLPIAFKGEMATGVTVITLNAFQDRTTVDLTISRRFTWQAEGENPMKSARESPEFVERTRAMWGRFLEKLRALSEAPPTVQKQ